MIYKIIAYFLFMLAPTNAHASDPTGLFFLIIIIPLLTFSIIFFIVSLLNPKVGLPLMKLLFFSHMVLQAIAHNGLLSDQFLLFSVFSFVINIIGIFLAKYRLHTEKAKVIGSKIK